MDFSELKHFKLARVVFLPFSHLYEFYLSGKYRKSEDSKYIRSLSNKHLNQRCFIIGNGPSLKPEDLEKLKDEISFGSNMIYCIFDRTNWRPTYYMFIDFGGIPSQIERIEKSGEFIKFINYKAASLIHKKDNRLWYVYLKGEFHIDPYKTRCSTLSEDVSKHLSKLHTVTANQIEMAIYMGFKEIYLLGVDNNYARKVDKNGRIYNDPSVQSSYFEGMQSINGKHQSWQNVDSMNYSYELCKRAAEEKNVKIYNATRGGKLEVFERVDFDSLFGGL